MQVKYILFLLTLTLTMTASAYGQTCGFFGDHCRETDIRPGWMDTTTPVHLAVSEKSNSNEEDISKVVAATIKSIKFKRNPKFASDEVGILLYGIDIVSIYNGSMKTHGRIRYSVAWNGGIWLFSNEENMNLFIENPMKYVPAYGGYCAFDMTRGVVIPATKLFHLHGRRLYMFNTNGRRQSWLENIPRHIAAADAKWDRLNTSSLIILEPSPAARTLAPLLGIADKTDR